MKDDYLWDGTGEPDPDVQHLEALLGGLAYDGPAPAVAAMRPRWPRWLAAGALAAVALLVAWTLRPAPPAAPPAPAAPWSVAGLADIAGLVPGHWIDTGEDAARVAVADIGTMDLAPNTRLRLKATGPAEHRLELARGEIHARVIAPPRLLVVETPSATAVDLGCVYDLSVGDNGDGELMVHAGQVALEAPGRDVIVPRGARASTRRGVGPGTPYFLDAHRELAAALAALDRDPSDRAHLDKVIALARPADSLSLYHLLPVVPPDLRHRVYDGLVALDPVLARNGPVQEAVLALDEGALERLRWELEPLWFQ